MQSLAFSLLKLLIRLSFPTVNQISTEKFAEWLADSAKQQPFVLDARSPAEYAVSHIKTSVRIDPVVPDITALSTVSKNTPIIVYCSVGYRSAKVAQQLDREGFIQIFNLSGGIFQWANEERPMFKDNEHSSQLVHPYNAIWGNFLKHSYRAENH
ncbi:rhodanese-like domain-containing protein [Nostoc sp. FACHB-152]|nr:rhodanese-like domain-containing protein [Nostoc sp. FACHB-152]MBD2472547.1 rhodanese-like domain-containing protein [Nostoc sp. FACHB-145]